VATGPRRFVTALTGRWRQHRLLQTSATAADLRRFPRGAGLDLRWSQTVWARLDAIRLRERMVTVVNAVRTIRDVYRAPIASRPADVRRPARDWRMTPSSVRGNPSGSSLASASALRDRRQIADASVRGVRRPIVDVEPRPASSRSSVLSLRASALDVSRFRTRVEVAQAAARRAIAATLFAPLAAVHRQPSGDASGPRIGGHGPSRMPRVDSTAATHRTAHARTSLTVRPTVASLRLDAHGAFVRHPARVEHPYPQVAMAMASRYVDASTQAAAPARTLAASPGRSGTTAHRMPPAPALEEVERTIAANVERRLDRKIGAAVRATLAADPDVSRLMTDRVYGDLYDRMVLERERLR
jgi:hypothetical protein